jgi:hypothetical protein
MSTRKRKSPAASADAIESLTKMVVDRMRAEGWSPPAHAPALPALPARPEPMQTLVLRVPRVLLDALDKRGPNRSDTARSVLAHALGLEIDPPRSGPGSAGVKRRR